MVLLGSPATTVPLLLPFNIKMTFGKVDKHYMAQVNKHLTMGVCGL